MDFTLSDDQQLLRETARSLFTKECPTTLLRAHMEDPSAADGLWAHLRDWVALADGPLADTCLFLEESGAVAAPGPFFATTALFAPLLRAAGHELADAASVGEITGTVAAAGGTGEWPFAAGEIPHEAVRTFVLEADRVDRVAVVLPGPAIAVVEPPPARLVDTVDSTRRVFEIDLPGDTGPALPIDATDFTAVMERAGVAMAADAVGTARRLLSMTIEYAKERVQFDRPIGSFQAVQHKLADMALDLERATAAVYYAAMTLDAGDPDRHRAAHVAKAAAGEAATHCAKDAVQLHGGIGFTWEHDLHLFIRRAYLSEHLLGTHDRHHDRLADLLLAGA